MPWQKSNRNWADQASAGTLTSVTMQIRLLADFMWCSPLAKQTPSHKKKKYPNYVIKLLWKYLFFYHTTYIVDSYIGKNDSVRRFYYVQPLEQLWHSSKNKKLCTIV